MYGPVHLRWLPAVALLVALPVRAQCRGPLIAGQSAAANLSSPDCPTPALSAVAPAAYTQPGNEERGDIFEVRERYQAAIDAYSKIEKPTPAVWNKMGIAYQMLFDLKDAARCYKAALHLDPGNQYALNDLATVDDELQEFSEAERYYRKALKLDPHSALFLKNLGTNLLLQHKYGQGAQAYDEALAIDPTIFTIHPGPQVIDPAPPRERGTASYFKAKSCARAGLNDCAIFYLRAALDEGSVTVKKIATDGEFQNLLGTPALQNLLAEEQ